MKLLRSHPDSPTGRSPTLLQPAFLATNEEKRTNEHIGEVRSEGKDLNIPLRDSRIKDVQKANMPQWLPNTQNDVKTKHAVSLTVQVVLWANPPSPSHFEILSFGQ